jgi:hypothetical protein
VKNDCQEPVPSYIPQVHNPYVPYISRYLDRVHVGIRVPHYQGRVVPSLKPSTSSDDSLLDRRPSHPKMAKKDGQGSVGMGHFVSYKQSTCPYGPEGIAPMDWTDYSIGLSSTRYNSWTPPPEPLATELVLVGIASLKSYSRTWWYPVEPVEQA